MNKKFVLAAVLVFVATGYMFIQGVAKAQDANATTNSDNAMTDNATNGENGTMNNGT
jgi:hypothetical protein